MNELMDKQAELRLLLLDNFFEKIEEIKITVFRMWQMMGISLTDQNILLNTILIKIFQFFVKNSEGTINKAWIQTTASNLAIDWKRCEKKKTKNEKILENSEEIYEWKGYTPPEILVARESKEEFRKFLAKFHKRLEKWDSFLKSEEFFKKCPHADFIMNIFINQCKITGKRNITAIYEELCRMGMTFEVGERQARSKIKSLINLFLEFFRDIREEYTEEGYEGFHLEEEEE